MPQSAMILTTACPKPAVPLEDCQRECCRVIHSASPRRSRYTESSSFPPSCTAKRPGSSIGSRPGPFSYFINKLTLRHLHQMARLCVKRRGRPEIQPAHHKAHGVSGAVSLGWPRHKDGRHMHIESNHLQRVLERKSDHIAARKSVIKIN